MRKALVVYLVAEPETPELARVAVEAGADVIELGFPFSDPLADGPVIQRASERALIRGMRTRRVPRLPGRDPRARARHAARPDDVRGDPRGVRLGALRRRRRAPDGATSLIVADLPAGRATGGPQRSSSSRRPRRTSGSASRRRATDGWLYLVTRTGTTGARAELSSALHGLVERARAIAGDLPLYAGFGISTPEHAAAAAALADGVVVGSRAVEVAEAGPDRARRVRGVAARGHRLGVRLQSDTSERQLAHVKGVRLKSDTGYGGSRLTARVRRGRASSRRSRRWSMPMNASGAPLDAVDDRLAMSDRALGHERRDLGEEGRKAIRSGRRR